MNNHQQEIVELQLKKLLGQKYFSISDLDSVASSLGKRIESHPYYAQLRALHCIHYSDMSASLRADIPNMVVACLRGEIESLASVMAKAVMMEGNSHQSFEDYTPSIFPSNDKPTLFKKLKALGN